MAVSGSEKTRIGASISGVGKRLTITPKAASGATKNMLDFERGFKRGKVRGMARGVG